MTSKILVIGAGGMLGDMACRYLREQGHFVVGVTRSQKRPGLVNLDATDEGALLPFLDMHTFDAVINCAALLVRASEARPADAVKLNAWVPHLLEEKYAHTNTHLIQVSTDGVFSGRHGDYQEDDASDAASIYGKSKYLGELDASKALTVRSGFWGCDVNASGAGLFQWFMRQEGTVKGYTQAFFNGVSNLEFAKFLDQALQSRWTGVYHLCAADVVSKYGFLQLQRRMFAKDIEICEEDSVYVNRVLRCTREDVPYQRKTFEQMMRELRAWSAKRDCYPFHVEG